MNSISSTDCGHSFSKLPRPSSLPLNRSNVASSKANTAANATVDQSMSLFSQSIARTPEEMDRKQFSQLLIAGFAAGISSGNSNQCTTGATASINEWNKKFV